MKRKDASNDVDKGGKVQRSIASFFVPVNQPRTAPPASAQPGPPSQAPAAATAREEGQTTAEAALDQPLHAPQFQQFALRAAATQRKTNGSTQQQQQGALLLGGPAPVQQQQPAAQQKGAFSIAESDAAAEQRPSTRANGSCTGLAVRAGAERMPSGSSCNAEAASNTEAAAAEASSAGGAASESVLAADSLAAAAPGLAEAPPEAPPNGLAAGQEERLDAVEQEQGGSECEEEAAVVPMETEYERARAERIRRNMEVSTQERILHRASFSFSLCPLLFCASLLVLHLLCSASLPAAAAWGLSYAEPLLQAHERGVKNTLSCRNAPYASVSPAFVHVNVQVMRSMGLGGPAVSPKRSLKKVAAPRRKAPQQPPPPTERKYPLRSRRGTGAGAAADGAVGVSCFAAPPATGWLEGPWLGSLCTCCPEGSGAGTAYVVAARGGRMCSHARQWPAMDWQLSRLQPAASSHVSPNTLMSIMPTALHRPHCCREGQQRAARHLQPPSRSRHWCLMTRPCCATCARWRSAQRRQQQAQRAAPAAAVVGTAAAHGGNVRLRAPRSLALRSCLGCWLTLPWPGPTGRAVAALQQPFQIVGIDGSLPSVAQLAGLAGWGTMR